MATYSVRAAPNEELTLTNSVCMRDPISEYVTIKSLKGKQGVFRTVHSDLIPVSKIGLGKTFRKFLYVAFDENVTVEPFTPTSVNRLTRFFTVRPIKITTSPDSVIINDVSTFAELNRDVPINPKCEYVYKGRSMYELAPVDAPDVFFIEAARFRVQRQEGVKSSSSSSQEPAVGTQVQNDFSDSSNEILSTNFDSKNIGIGGLGLQLKIMFQNAFSGRILEDEARAMGVPPVRGILLWGSPGCGKTLIARQVSKILNAKSYTYIAGPELKDKWVGGSEERVRSLFTKAEQDSKNGQPGLHVVVLDEFDSLGSTRTDSVGSNLGNDIVNQFLSKIDGINALNNLLLIAMTNRKSAIDPALLRPGRFELHIEIPLPNLDGRREIFEIHTKTLLETGRLAPDVDVKVLADMTPNFSGAEIKSVVDKAVNRQLTANIDPDTLRPIDPNRKTIVSQEDFILSVTNTTPQMSSSLNDIRSITRVPIDLSNEQFKSVYDDVMSLMVGFFRGELTARRGRNLTVLITGPPFSGKTKMIAHIINEIMAGIEHTKFINPEFYMNNPGLWSKFEDGRNFKSYLMVIDSIESIIPDNVISREISQLRTIMNSNVAPDRFVATVVTCSDPNILKGLHVYDKFTKRFHIDAEYSTDN
jgi:vesicle-fusing ATPase